MIVALSFALTGCVPAPPVTPIRPVYVDLERLQPLHPAWAQLATVDAQIAAAKRGEGPAAPGTELPEEDWAELPRPETPPEPDRGPAVARAKGDLDEDRRMAESVARSEAEEAYLDDLRRLTLSLRAAREPVPEIAIEDYQQAVRQAGEQIARLEAQLHALRPNAETDRFYYPPAQLRRRAELYEQARQELEALKTGQIAHLRSLLVRREPPPVTVPQEKLAALAKQRDAAIARATADLRAGEAQQLAALPAPDAWSPLVVPPALGWAPDRDGRGRMAEEAARAANETGQARAARAAALEGALRRLRAQQRLLAARVAEETAVAARNAARDLHLELRPRRSAGVPDATTRLKELVRGYFERAG